MNPNLSQPSRVPYWAIWLGLLVVLAILVSGAFLLNRQFRARIGIQEGTVSLTAPSAAASPAPVGPVATASVASPVASSEASNAAFAGPSASGDTSPVAQQVAAAYQHYWSVYSDAAFRLDTSQLPQVASGQELKEIQDEIEGLRQRNRAARIVVEHHYFVFNVTATEADVYDEVHNQSFFIDPVTKQPPTGSQQTDIEKDTFFFANVDGTWKVTRSTRQRDSGQ